MIPMPSVPRGNRLGELGNKACYPTGWGGVQSDGLEKAGLCVQGKILPGRLGATGSVRDTTAQKSSFDLYR